MKTTITGKKTKTIQITTSIASLYPDDNRNSSPEPRIVFRTISLKDSRGYPVGFFVTSSQKVSPLPEKLRLIKVKGIIINCLKARFGNGLKGKTVRYLQSILNTIKAIKLFDMVSFCQHILKPKQKIIRNNSLSGSNKRPPSTIWLSTIPMTIL